MKLWDLKKHAILIVDDFPEMRSTLRGMLLPWQPKRVDTARNGDEAIERLQQDRYDIILCDFNLGDGKNGQQVLEEARYRNLLPFSSIFIMISAETSAQMVMGALEQQPDGYISKPVTRVTLQLRLRKFVEKQQALRPVTRALDSKRFREAITHIDQYLAGSNKYRFELYKLKSELLIRIGDYEKSEILCQAVLDGRDLPWARFDLGRIRYFAQDYAAAAETFEHILANQPNFIAAWDWLARAREKLGRLREAQDALMEGVQRSPQSLLRQRMLAEIADRNDDLDTTEAARRRAIRVGKGSILRRPGDYAALSRVLVRREAGKEALRIAGAIRTEFGDSPLAQLEAAAASSDALLALDKPQEASAALDDALTLARAHPELLDTELGMSLTRCCLAQDRPEAADEVVRNVISRHHDDPSTLDRIRALYEKSGGAGIDNLIEQTRKEIVRINNQGVKLLRDGDIEASIELFSQAAAGMPHNPVINLNAAQSLVQRMRKQGVTREDLGRALGHIQAAGDHEQHRERQNRLLESCRELAAQLPQPAPEQTADAREDTPNREPA
ncbi:MAG TPA: response regulator [Gammaproteobacteria bacterium]|nr:response regulator [Gammaproteobacteria bacterium]